MDLKELSNALDGFGPGQDESQKSMICKQCFMNRDRQGGLPECQNDQCMFFQQQEPSKEFITEQLNRNIESVLSETSFKDKLNPNPWSPNNISFLDWTCQAPTGWTLPSSKPVSTSSGPISVSSSDDEEIFDDTFSDRRLLANSWMLQTDGKPYSLFGASNSFSSIPLTASSSNSSDLDDSLSSHSSEEIIQQQQQQQQHKLHLFLSNTEDKCTTMNSFSKVPFTPTSYVAGAETYSRKVFVGGLPPDIDEDEIRGSFCKFGNLTVDWPHKAQSRTYFPPKGYAFLLFKHEFSVHLLIAACLQESNKLFYFVSSPTHKNKQVQIRPWSVTESDFVMDKTQPIDPRKTIFVGGVPRPLRAQELAQVMEEKFGSVCYAGIDVDPDLKYPKGAGRVSFSSMRSYISAVSARFVQLKLPEIDKKVEVKPFVMDDQLCDECNGLNSGGKAAPFFCGNVNCLRYFCEHCWAVVHAYPSKQTHRPLIKEGGDRIKARWSQSI